MAKEKIEISRQASANFFPDTGNLITVTKKLIEDEVYVESIHEVKTLTLPAYEVTTEATIEEKDEYGNTDFSEKQITLHFSEEEITRLVAIFNALKKENLEG